MRYRWFIVVALAVLLAGSVLGENSAGAEDSYDSEELEFLKTVNQYRQNGGLAALSAGVLAYPDFASFGVQTAEVSKLRKVPPGTVGAHPRLLLTADV